MYSYLDRPADVRLSSVRVPMEDWEQEGRQQSWSGRSSTLAMGDRESISTHICDESMSRPARMRTSSPLSLPGRGCRSSVLVSEEAILLRRQLGRIQAGKQEAALAHTNCARETDTVTGKHSTIYKCMCSTCTCTFPWSEVWPTDVPVRGGRILRAMVRPRSTGCSTATRPSHC